MVVIFRINRRYIFYKISVVIFILILFLFLLHVFEVTYNFLHQSELNYCPQNEPIDVVYTWVNGSDPKFVEDLNFFLRNKFYNVDSSKQRFDDKYELKFSLRSLEKYAPWVNHVYIVTNGQIPYWLNLDYEKVSIITHEEMFKDTFNLPSFSSPAIECNIHRIPGLSKRFIYFNDDVFLGSPTYVEDFFSANKGFLVYLAWPVPLCAPNCPWMYVNDGQCDKACLNADCQMDGLDCEDNKIDTVDISTDNELVKLENDSNITDTTYLRFKTSSLNVFKNQSNKTNANDIKRNYLFNLLHFKIKSNLTHLVREHNKRILNSDKLKRVKSKKLKRKLFSSSNESFIKKLQPAHNIDAYSSSLQYTNRMLNKKYGFKTRKVPSHAPIMIDREIMENLQNSFVKEFIITENNRIRSSDDVQFSFSYYYFLMSERLTKSADEIFDVFDTDFSGTWSDREIRTLLTKLYELPLSYAIVDHFESTLLNCSENREFPEVPTPPYERYTDSRLTTISKQLILDCKVLSNLLIQRFGQTTKYSYEIVQNAESKYVTFKMLNSNISDVVSHLDDIRSNLKKFVCLNDNLDEAKVAENELINSILYDFYLSLFPHPSKFELPKDYRNKFMYMHDLNEWKDHHYRLKMFVYCVSVVLMYFTFFNMCKRKLCQYVNKLFCCYFILLFRTSLLMVYPPWHGIITIILFITRFFGHGQCTMLKIHLIGLCYTKKYH